MIHDLDLILDHLLPKAQTHTDTEKDKQTQRETDRSRQTDADRSTKISERT